jgi:surfactin synthase thioesterase subunit
MNPWFVIPRQVAAPRLRLICFPYAGGSAALFREWPRRVPADVEVWATQPPGRAFRLAEPPLVGIDRIVDAVWPTLASSDSPLVLFGHSMGAKVVVALARRLQAAGRPPARLIVSGQRPPHLPRLRDTLHELPRAAFVARLREYGGTPAEVLANQELLDLVLPALRADFESNDTWACSPEPRLSSLLTVIGGEDDDHVPLADLERWRELAPSATTTVVPGGHFFMHDWSRLAPILLPLLAPLPSK